LKELGVTRMDILEAMADSSVADISGDGKGIRRREGEFPEEILEPKPSKKLKTEKGAVSYAPKESFNRVTEPKLFQIVLESPSKRLRAHKLRIELEKVFGCEILYATIHEKVGYFAVDPAKLSEEYKQKMASTVLELYGIPAKILECFNEDLDEFMKRNGKQLSHYLERSGIRHKIKGGKDEIDLVFYSKKYNDIAPLDYMFHGILTKTKIGEQVNLADSALLKEFGKYLENPTMIEDAESFTVDFHPNDPSKRCFLAVKPDGSKIPFSFDDLSENLLEKFLLPKLEQQGQTLPKAV